MSNTNSKRVNGSRHNVVRGAKARCVKVNWRGHNSHNVVPMADNLGIPENSAAQVLWKSISNQFNNFMASRRGGQR